MLIRDCIHAIIKGSAINNDGSLKVGYTAPSIEGQAQVISDAQMIAGVEADSITYIEAHGTGTELGDPVEISALTKAFRQTTAQKNFCAIGSLKTNMGHLDAAAGVAGLIKTVLALKHQSLPPSLHFEHPNPKIDFANSPFYVNTTLSEWKSNGTPRRAGVSAFGIGGTNAHVILEEAPVQNKAQQRPGTFLQLFVLSAKSEAALKELVSLYQGYLKTTPDLNLANVCATTHTGRVHFSHRLAVTAANQRELATTLNQLHTSDEVDGVSFGQIPTSDIAPKIAFLFTGQGSQYLNMGQRLYQDRPVFRSAIDQCDQILQPELGMSVLDVLYPDLGNRKQDLRNKEDSGLLDQTAYTQPALFAIEYALAQLWLSWGIKPDVVMGHSVGEVVAAVIAGLFSLEAGLKLISARGRLMQRLPAGGQMISVMASEAQVRSLMPSPPTDLSIAAINGPTSVVISGTTVALGAIATQLESAGIKTKPLQVSHAFHSPLMEPMLAEFATVAAQLTYHPPRLPLISNVTGAVADGRVATADYWVEHIRQPVQFARSMATLSELGYDCFLEIGPQPLLIGDGASMSARTGRTMATVSTTNCG